MRFYLVVNLDKANAADCAAEAAAELRRCGAEVLLTPELNAVLNCSGCQVLDEREAMQSCDAAISIGGDGTMIHTALDALEFDRPVIGINSGRLGYLTQIEPPFGDSCRSWLPDSSAYSPGQCFPSQSVSRMAAPVRAMRSMMWLLPGRWSPV